MNISTPSEIYEKGINPYAITLYNVLYILAKKSCTDSTNVKNNELSVFLKWEIKTISKYIKQLKDLNLIIIKGSTRNRSISCNYPSDILKTISIVNKKYPTERIKEKPIFDIEKLRADKWLIEHLSQITTKEKNEQLRQYLQTKPEGLAFEDKIILQEKGDIQRAKTFNTSGFMNFIINKKTAAEKKERFITRALEYDRQHKREFINELNYFYRQYSNTSALDAYKHRKYQKLSDCPYELIEMFLNWLEPELF